MGAADAGLASPIATIAPPLTAAIFRKSRRETDRLPAFTSFDIAITPSQFLEHGCTALPTGEIRRFSYRSAMEGKTANRAAAVLKKHGRSPQRKNGCVVAIRPAANSRTSISLPRKRVAARRATWSRQREQALGTFPPIRGALPSHECRRNPAQRSILELLACENNRDRNPNSFPSLAFPHLGQALRSSRSGMGDNGSVWPSFRSELHLRATVSLTDCPIVHGPSS